MDFLCNECAKTFAKEVDLVIHQARAHDKRSFSCEMCHVINVGYTNHNNHMRVHKPKKKTTRLLKCEKSYYETNKKQNLNRHILTVHNEKRDSNKSKNRIKKIYITHHVFLEIVPSTGTRNNKTQRQLCKRLAGPFIPFSWSERVSLWM